MSHVSFLAEILEAPDDDGPRLVYADWLSEQGDPRGEFIRLQCLLERMPKDDPRRRKLRSRELELLKAHSQEWAAPIKDNLKKVEFRRGFVASAKMRMMHFVEKGDRLLAQTPLDAVHLTGGHRMASKFAQCSHLGRIRNLRLDEATFAVNELSAILASPHISQLTSLDISSINDKRLDLIASCSSLSNLQTFCFRDRIFREHSDHLVKLVQSPHFANIRELYFATCMVRDRGLNAIAASPYLRNLERLVMLSNCSDEGLKQLANSQNMTNAKYLLLSHGSGRVGPDGVEAIANSDHLSNLEEFHLNHQQIGDVGAQHFARSTTLKSLKVLSLIWNGISDSGAKAFANSQMLFQLDRLDLRQNAINLDGVTALAESKYLKRGRDLYLDGNIREQAQINELRKKYGRTFGNFDV